ncbi:unnamed protein product [Strongylus vulgaris]|uniref:Uncharacterized protein n=1 Tax=Strongylus vulgaris TaxID=40348 RepID=A0A3P7LLB2_STRVU|nr:unnamed protein product [Strongylus vulgaris]
MEANNVAATIHTIAKRCQVKEDRPPLKGIVLTSDASKEIASDMLGPGEITARADRTSTGKRSATESGMSGTTSTGGGASTSARKRRRSNEVGVTSSSSSEMAKKAENPEKRDKHKRRTITKRGGAVQVIEGELEIKGTFLPRDGSAMN